MFDRLIKRIPARVESGQSSSDSKTQSAKPQNTVIDAQEAGTITMRAHSVQCKVRNEFLNAPASPVTMVFMRPALRKAPAVQLYNDLIKTIHHRMKRWQTFQLKTENPERIQLISFSSFRCRINGGIPGIFGDKSFILLAYEPEDGSANFVRSIAPNSNLIVVGSSRYLERNPGLATPADLVICIGSSRPNVVNANILAAQSPADVAPAIKHWVESWIFERNRGFVPLFGSKEDLEKIKGHPEFAQTGADLLCLSRAGTPDAFESKKTCVLRDSFAKRMDAAYIRLADFHRYSGIITDENREQHERLSELIKRGLFPITLGFDGGK